MLYVDVPFVVWLFLLLLFKECFFLANFFMKWKKEKNELLFQPTNLTWNLFLSVLSICLGRSYFVTLGWDRSSFFFIWIFSDHGGSGIRVLVYEEDRTRKGITCGIERRKNTFQTLYYARNSTDLSQTVYIFAIYMRYDVDHSN